MNSNAKPASKQSDAQIMKAQKARLSKLKDALMELHFLDLHEIEGILKDMQFMPKVAYDEMHALIRAGKSKQNDYLKEQIKRNPAFVDQLETAVSGEYKKIISEVAEMESSSADTILDQLYEGL